MLDNDLYILEAGNNYFFPDGTVSRPTNASGKNIKYRCITDDPNYILNPPPPDPDRDHDGILNDDDNCPDVANPMQANLDGVGLGNACSPCEKMPGNSDIIPMVVIEYRRKLQKGQVCAITTPQPNGPTNARTTRVFLFDGQAQDQFENVPISVDNFCDGAFYYVRYKIENRITLGEGFTFLLLYSDVGHHSQDVYNIKAYRETIIDNTEMTDVPTTGATFGQYTNMSQGEDILETEVRHWGASGGSGSVGKKFWFKINCIGSH
ncbi:MAG: hypothetical protein HY390_06260 [Deltaproteobacteria bacterium]|nr:hypothetical protein [Deltaproteobacteria bacterium]